MNSLENLSDDELIDLSEWYGVLSAREKDTMINYYSTKFSSHAVRLGLEVEQILIEHDLDIERNKEVLKSIRRGEWSIDRIKEFCSQKERHLDDLYQKSTLRHLPDEKAIKDLLLNCLEQHYGSLNQAVKREVPVERMIAELKAVLEKYEGR
jgi:hypothetical protein